MFMEKDFKVEIKRKMTKKHKDKYCLFVFFVL